MFVEVPVSVTLRDLLRGHQQNLPDKVVGRLFRMRHVAVHHHDLEVRKTGEPYHEHCLVVEAIVRLLGGGEEEQEAACGHDLFEACIESGTLEEIREELKKHFSARVILLIEALTKYDSDTYWDQLFRANIKDPWVVIIKVADRLHNLETIIGFSLPKRREYLQETLGPMMQMCNKAMKCVESDHPDLLPIYKGLTAQLEETARANLERVEKELELILAF